MRYFPVYCIFSLLPVLAIGAAGCSSAGNIGKNDTAPGAAENAWQIEVAARDPAAVTHWYDTALSMSPVHRSSMQGTHMLNGSVIMVRGVVGNESKGPVGIILNAGMGELLPLQNFAFDRCRMCNIDTSDRAYLSSFGRSIILQRPGILQAATG